MVKVAAKPKGKETTKTEKTEEKKGLVLADVAKMFTNVDPKDKEAKKAQKEALKQKYKRSDFAEWEAWCEFKGQQHRRRAAMQLERAELWEKKKAGEHLDKQAKKLKRIEKLKKQLEALETEIAASGEETEE